MDSLSPLTVIDEFGFAIGTLKAECLNDFNRDKTVSKPIPMAPLSALQGWCWRAGEWVQATDYRGHTWYHPNDSTKRHDPRFPDDAPPFGWRYWTPGENVVVSPQEANRRQWALIRKLRDERLAASDWIVTKSTEEGVACPSDWVCYRQALRDITEQVDPFFIVWPKIPQGDPVVTDVQTEYLGSELLP